MSGNPKESFRTHSNYLKAFQKSLEYHFSDEKWPWCDHSDLLKGIVKSVLLVPSYLAIQVRPQPDLPTIERALNIAWATEKVLGMPDEMGADVLSVANNWAVVQT